MSNREYQEDIRVSNCRRSGIGGSGFQNLLVIECLRRHVETLAARIGERNVWRPAALQASADYIRREWEDMGYAVRRQGYTVLDQACENLEVQIDGRVRPSEIILVGAHYDTVAGSPGADDNASGIAGILEIARHLRDMEPARTIRLVAFVNEEAPFFFSRHMGSTVYARTARARGDDIQIMMSLEMLGCYDGGKGSQDYPPFFRHFYPDRGDFIAFVSNLRSRKTLAKVVKTFHAQSDFPSESLASLAFVPGVALSDQLSFWRQGYSGVMVTDTAFYRYPHYHQASDTPDKICFPEMSRVVDGLARTVQALADQ